MHAALKLQIAYAGQTKTDTPEGIYQLEKRIEDVLELETAFEAE